MSVRILAALFGLLFLAFGVLGYMPDYVTDGNLFGIFQTDTIHNNFYLACGVFALLCALNYSLSRFYFQIFGLLYGIITVLGFVWSGDLIITQANMADNILHLVITVIFLFFGFIVNVRRY